MEYCENFERKEYFNLPHFGFLKMLNTEFQ
jgi:hypothetical protein